MAKELNEEFNILEYGSKEFENPMKFGNKYYKPNNTIKAVIYSRYSSDSQRDASIDAQVRAAHKYAEANDIKIVGEYADRAKSATSDKRPAFQQMIADSKLGKFDAVIVHKLDRFSGSKYDSVIYKPHKSKWSKSYKCVREFGWESRSSDDGVYV